MKNRIVWLALMFSSFLSQAQVEQGKDTVKVLNEVTIQAYSYKRALNEVPASVGTVSEVDFNKSNSTSLLPALNTVPGVRMEERSPGSYRLSMRGSSLRSPFGVRNVKVYLDNLPFTDPGGNTYLNLLDNSMVQQAEIIKGPGSSVYGAGTGGVLLLTTPWTEMGKAQAKVSTTMGSYGLLRYQAGASVSTGKVSTGAQYSHHQSEGYRQQSAMYRDAFQAKAEFEVNEKRKISGTVFYSDLFYQTPGALTLAQYQQDPTMARPPAGPNRGTIEQRASVSNKTFYAGVSHDYQINERWANLLSVYSTNTQYENPTFRNFERKAEQGFGGRSVTQYNSEWLSLHIGGEFQHGFAPIKTYTNNFGVSGPTLTDDELTTDIYMAFAQGEWKLPAEILLTTGLSVNYYQVRFKQLFASPPLDTSRLFKPVLTPRIAAIRKFSNAISIFASYSKGFSNPTRDELYPSTAVFDMKIKPEFGTNYETGVRGKLFQDKLNYDVTAYLFLLKNAIVSRRDATMAGNPEYFVNAGKTKQKGLEGSLIYYPISKANYFISDLKLWTTISINDYVFTEYVQNVTDYSGNKLTGVPNQMINAGTSVKLKSGTYLSLLYNHTGKIPLNDGNTEFSKPYDLLNAKISQTFIVLKKLELETFVGGDNLLDKQYVLGHDLNAFGGRFYNAAPLRNYYAGLSIKWNFK